MSSTTNTISYYVNDSLIGECVLKCEGYNIPYSLAFVCTTCGNLWGRCVVNEGQEWDVFGRPCETHLPRHNADNSAAPGSLLCPSRTLDYSPSRWWSGVTDYMPRSVLEREFLLAMTHWERRDVSADQEHTNS